MQEKSLTDWILRVEDNDLQPVADAMGYKLKEAERETHADRACLDAFASQVKAGLGWVEVGNESDPFGYPYRIDEVPWKELAWDQRARKPSLKDAQYIRRQRFYRKDDVMAAFPGQEFPITVAGTSEDFMVWAEPEQLLREHANIRDLSRYDSERQDRRRDTVAVEEVWYRVKVPGYVFWMPDGTPKIFDENNQAHLMAYNRGLIEPKAKRLTKMRQGFWIGPHCLADRWSTLPHNEFPYVPFFAHQEARTGVPYGLIRVMRPLQDEVNTRRAKMMANLNSVRVLADDDAVADHDKARADVARRNAYIMLNANRRNSDGFRIDKNQELNAQQWEVYQDAVAKIQETSGIKDSLLGGVDKGANSGVAIQQLIDQSLTTLGKINANYREARNQVGTLLLAHVVSDMAKKRDIELAYQDKQGAAKSVVVNAPAIDDAGYEYLKNDITRIKMKVVLDEVPSSPTYRAQQFQEIMRVLQSMPENVQQLMIPVMVEASELPNRKEVAKMLREQLGISEPTTDEEAQKQQIAKQQADAMQQAEMQAMQGKADQESAKAAKLEAETAEIRQDMEAQAITFAAGPPPAENQSIDYRW